MAGKKNNREDEEGRGAMVFESQNLLQPSDKVQIANSLVTDTRVTFQGRH